jgi:cytochrome c biogenesis protein CcmG, thiol:disulfide interchange protein DsbE
MQWKRLALPLVALPIIGLLWFGLKRAPFAKIVPTPLAGQVAPDFSLTTLDGDSLRLSSLRGQVVVLNFWASWCIPCLQEHPLLVAADERWRSQGVRIVGVVYQDTPTNARDWLRERGGTWRHVLDPSSRLSIEYGLFGVPETYFINRHGVIAYKHIGPLTADTLSRWITRLLTDSTTSEPTSGGTQ